MFLEKHLKIPTRVKKQTNFLKINLSGKERMVQKWKCIRKKPFLELTTQHLTAYEVVIYAIPECETFYEQS